MGDKRDWWGPKLGRKNTSLSQVSPSPPFSIRRSQLDRRLRPWFPSLFEWVLLAPDFHFGRGGLPNCQIERDKERKGYDCVFRPSFPSRFSQFPLLSHLR